MTQAQKTETVMLYATFPDKAAALVCGKILVQEKMVACINIIPGVHSVYEWEGVLQEAEEVVMIAKTIAIQAEETIGRIAAFHPYSCPCVVSFAIENGHPAFLGWMKEMVRAV